jgi:hypothetical protein
MATPVGQLTIEMAANIVRLQKDMDAARKTVDGAMASIGKSVESAMRTVGGLFAGVSIGAFTGKLVSVEREFGKLNASLVTVTGSTREADAAFAMLTEFANTTPFSLQEVTQAFIKLKAMGLDPSQSALTSYGNTASAMGKSLNQMIEAVADASTGQFERLLEFGIKSKSEGDKVTFLFRGLSTTIGKNSDEIVAYLKNIGLVDFAGGMERQSKTLDGAISNLAGAWDGLFATINNEMTGPLLMASVKSAESAIIGLGNVVKNFSQFMEQNKVALMAFAALLAGPAIVSGIGAATAAFIAMRTAVVGLTLAFASNPIALAILAITAAAVPAIDGIQRYMNANKALEKEQAGLNQTQAETERLLRQAEPVKAKAVVSTKALTDADKERAKELKKQEDAYTKLLNDINDKNGAMLLEQQQTEKLTDSQKLALKIMQDIQSGTLKLNDAQKIKITQSLEELLTTERLNAEMKDLAKTQQAAIDLSDKLNDEQYKTTESMRATVVSLIEQNDELRLGKDAVIARQVAVMRSTATDLEFAAATYEGNEQLAEQARLLRQQADLVEDNAMLSAAKEANKELDKTTKSVETIESSLTDALMRGFESGKGFGENLADTLKNMFSTLILKPIIEPIAKGASSVILSLMGMGASGSASAGGLGSAITLGGVGLSAIGQSIATGFMTTIGGGSVTAAASAYSAAGMGGVSAGLSAGSMAATAMPYVAAALVAANALGLMRSNKTVGGGVTGTLGGDLQEYDLNRRGGSLFSGPDYSIANMRVSETTEGINAAFTAIRDKSLAAAHALGSYNTGLETFTYTLSEQLHPDLNALGLVLDGLTADQKQEKIQGVLRAAEEAMAAIIVGASGLQLAGETAVEALNRLMVIQTASEMLNQFGGAFSAFATSSIDARNNIIELAGGLDQLVQKTQGFIANFYTREEQAGITARGVVQALEAAGFTASQIAALETKQDFRTLLESIDVSTDIGQQQFVALLDLQAQYATTSVLMEEQGKTLLAIADAAPQIEMLQRMLETDAEYQTRVQTAEEQAQVVFEDILLTMGQVDISINNLTQIMATRLDRLASDMANAQAEANAAAANAIAVANASAQAAIAAANAAAEAAAAAYNDQFSGAAMGGYIDGPTLVGEHGPEIFDPRQSQIYTAPATSNIFGGNELTAEMRALRDEVSMMRYETRSTAVNTAKIARLQDNWDVRGLTVRTDVDQPLDTVTV